MLIDTHAHLTDSVYDPNSPDFLGISVTDIISSMPSDGLSKIITIGYDVQTSVEASIIASKYENVYFAAGIHPSEAGAVVAEDFSGSISAIEKLLLLNKCVAIGEIGLDYHYDNTDKAAQKKVMLAQIELSEKYNKPVIFHVRDSVGDSYDIIKSNMDKLKCGGVMHCYSSSPEMAKEFIKLGLYISFSGSLTFKNAVNLAATAKEIDKSRILLETDCPYLAPTPYRGKTNYPKFVNLTAVKLAELWEIDVKEVMEITTRNAIKAFNLV